SLSGRKPPRAAPGSRRCESARDPDSTRRGKFSTLVSLGRRQHTRSLPLCLAQEGAMGTHREEVASMTADAGSGSRALKAILAGGLIGGAFDITYACTVWWFRGVTPIRVGQSVASGLLGRDAAVAGGVPVGLLGFVLHFSIAIVMAAVYYAAATR